MNGFCEEDRVAAILKQGFTQLQPLSVALRDLTLEFPDRPPTLTRAERVRCLQSNLSVLGSQPLTATRVELTLGEDPKRIELEVDLLTPSDHPLTGLHRADFTTLPWQDVDDPYLLDELVLGAVPLTPPGEQPWVIVKIGSPLEKPFRRLVRDLARSVHLGRPVAAKNTLN